MSGKQKSQGIGQSEFEALVNRLYWRYYLYQAVEIAERVEKLVERHTALHHLSARTDYASPINGWNYSLDSHV